MVRQPTELHLIVVGRVNGRGSDFLGGGGARTAVGASIFCSGLIDVENSFSCILDI